MINKVLLFLSFLSIIACKSNSASILNKNDNAIMPAIENDVFVVTKIATDKQYGYSENYPVNLGFSTSVPKKNASRYLDAIFGPSNQKISYEFIESCCPFTSKSGSMGTGLLDKYKITWSGNKTPLYLYINLYEKGDVLIPYGLTAKK